jgi:hypothetical protein
MIVYKKDIKPIKISHIRNGDIFLSPSYKQNIEKLMESKPWKARQRKAFFFPSLLLSSVGNKQLAPNTTSSPSFFLHH